VASLRINSQIAPRLVLSCRWGVVAKNLEHFACLSIEDDVRVSEHKGISGRRNLFTTGINVTGTRVLHIHAVKGHDPDGDVVHMTLFVPGMIRGVPFGPAG